MALEFAFAKWARTMQTDHRCSIPKYVALDATNQRTT